MSDLYSKDVHAAPGEPPPPAIEASHTLGVAVHKAERQYRLAILVTAVIAVVTVIASLVFIILQQGSIRDTNNRIRTLLQQAQVQSDNRQKSLNDIFDRLGEVLRIQNQVQRTATEADLCDALQLIVPKSDLPGYCASPEVKKQQKTDKNSASLGSQERQGTKSQSASGPSPSMSPTPSPSARRSAAPPSPTSSPSPTPLAGRSLSPLPSLSPRPPLPLFPSSPRSPLPTPLATLLTPTPTPDAVPSPQQLAEALCRIVTDLTGLVCEVPS